MAPTILVAGATGNTGVGVVRTLSADPGPFEILGTTRSTSGKVAQELAQLPKVSMVEQDWTLIDAAWLKEHAVKRVFIASAVGPSQYQDEALFLNAALAAGVEYVVRISTTTSNVGPATPVFYGRNHWAVETMLAAPEFKGLKWTSLQPNVFTMQIGGAATAWLAEYRKSGKKAPFKTIIAEDAPVALIDGAEVGEIAGTLLRLDDPSAHAGKRYTLVGPQDVTGADLVELLEKHAGTRVDEQVFCDESFAPVIGKMAGYPENVWKSLAKAPVSTQDGRCSLEASPTSPEIMKLRAPKKKGYEQIDAALAAVGK